ncbi:MAG: Sulfur oxidation protein SoxYZ sulfur covalently binding protein SoxYZ [uncultured Sulfurovum sp.]|uniref:Sulfur oxidation protein SoxYZ sulfur covalently binding protein SoxYZ n=1 Tax=uncultured Sulfurovum sp. TaxID=269237 RepID=A0A6S6SEV2_9BACT|nr:MAG: Sulfur oxidation protein SoxYZ sulfur covalently binding protein SoxYZ [uncultured Sulfurovum sp.]
MKRRHFLALASLSSSYLFAIDFRETKAKAWKARKLNDAAVKLYGEEKFATLQVSDRVVIEADKFIVPNARQIPVKFRSDIEAKSVALFQTANDQSLVAVFSINKGMIIDYELNIRMDRKGTFFVVVEGLDDKLYYTRQFIDVNEIRCSSGG